MTTRTPQELLALAERLETRANWIRGEWTRLGNQPWGGHLRANVEYTMKFFSDKLTEDAATVRALAAAPSAGAGAQEAVPGSDVLCESCARVFCPHEDRLHFDKDGCPSCEEPETEPMPPTPPHDTLDRDALVKENETLREVLTDLRALWRLGCSHSSGQTYNAVYNEWHTSEGRRMDVRVAAALARLRAPTPTGETR